MTTSEAKNYAFPAAIGGSIGIGLTMSRNLTPALGSGLATLAGAAASAAVAVVVYSIVESFTKRRTVGRRNGEAARANTDA